MATTPFSTSSSAPALNPLDTDPTTPLQPNLRPPMPRAMLTPIASDLFPKTTTTSSLITTAAAPAPPPRPPMSTGDVRILDYITFKVDISGKNFSKWRKLFLFLLQRCRARDHVEDAHAYAAADEAWRDADGDIVLWMVSTVSEPLQDIIIEADSTAYSAWTRLHTYFYDNMEGQAMHLSQEFRDTPRGDLSIEEYCRRLQHIADQLAEVGAPIDDRTLTMQMVDGLGDKFAVQAEIFQVVKPFPTFAEARSRLLLAERALDKKARSSSAQVLAAHGGGRGGGRGDGADPGNNGAGRGDSAGRGQGQGHRGGHQQGGSGHQPSGGGGHQYQQGGGGGGYQHQHGGGGHGYRGGGRGGGRGRGRGDGHGGGRGAHHAGHGGPGQQPWLGYFAPWNAPFPPRSLLGPGPGGPSQAYPVLYSGPPPPGHHAPPSWDHNTMMQQAPSYGNAFPQHGGWLMDSGASSHVTGNQGFPNQDAHHEIQ